MKAQRNQNARATFAPPPASFSRRLGAAFYDLLLLAAVWWFAAIPFVAASGGPPDSFWTRAAFQLYLLDIGFVYYAGFWVRGGQTLGLRTWKLQVLTTNSGPITWLPATKRFAAGLLSLACLGFGFFWALVDRRSLAWHDRLSGTRLIHLKSDAAAQKK